MPVRPTARRVSALFIVAATLAPLAAPLAAEVNLFAEPAPRKRPEPPRNPVIGFLVDVLKSDSSEGDGTTQQAGMPHLLTFQDGRQLQGQVILVTKDEVQLQRHDASEVLRFRTREIKALRLGNLASRPDENMPWGRPVPQSGPLFPPASAKLPNGDWLYADVTSKDGETFEFDLGSNARLTVPRAAIEWLTFQRSPAASFELTADPAMQEGWAFSSAGGAVEEKDGWLQVTGANWVGRSLSAPNRFEVALEMPVGEKESMSLWLQPFGPQTNSYGRGTVELEFRHEELRRCIYINALKHETTPFPKETTPDGRARFRVFYDGDDRKLIVFRNGKQIGEWPLSDKAQPNEDFRQITGICLSRRTGNGLRVGRFQLLPWDGRLPQEGEAPLTQDQLVTGTDKPATAILGKLESIGPRSFQFSGATKPRTHGQFLRFPVGAPLKERPSDVLMDFGSTGSFRAASFQLKDEQATFQTSFCEAATLPMKALQIIRFPLQPTATSAQDTLIFKNGDELPGQLLRAKSGESLRWKMESGQELDLLPERVAGVRLAITKSPVRQPRAVLDLKNGDRLWGRLVGMDARQLRFQHSILGDLAIDRTEGWRLYPQENTTVLDAAAEASLWVEAAGMNSATNRTMRIVYLDGHFGLRPVRQGYSVSPTRISRKLEGLGSKIEIRAEALNLSGTEPNFSLQLNSTRGDTYSNLDLDFNYGSLRFYGYVSGKKFRNFWKDIQYREIRNGFEHNPRLSVRVFIDNATGAVNVYINGEHKVKAAPTEYLPGIAGTISVGGYTNDDLPLMVSDLWVGPWNGELPQSGAPASVHLSNGDVAEGLPTAIQGQKLQVESAIGPVEIPLDRVQAVDFASMPTPAAGPIRVRLATGDALNVDRFSYENGQLQAHSLVTGDFTVASESVREIVFQAMPRRFPQTPAPRKQLTEQPPAPAAR